MRRVVEDEDKVIRTHRGQGRITFPRGGRIQSNFVLTEHVSGKRRLTCSGRFKKAGYAGWEQLVSHYQVEPRTPTARQAWRAESYEGRTEQNQQLTIERMFLVGASATDALTENLKLEMRFECQDVSLQP